MGSTAGTGGVDSRGLTRRVVDGGLRGSRVSAGDGGEDRAIDVLVGHAMGVHGQGGRQRETENRGK